jgi:cupin fold WbuC family metalloprotein
MSAAQMPKLSEEEVLAGICQARKSERRRFPKLLHGRGEEFNQVFNFMMQDSYMQPHLHPGAEKIEKIYLIEGRVAVLWFDDLGQVIECTCLEKGESELIEIPAFTWHTYVMLTDHVITYETMMGIYNPQTWKRFAEWAPREGSLVSLEYLNVLRREVAKRIS